MKRWLIPLVIKIEGQFLTAIWKYARISMYQNIQMNKIYQISKTRFFLKSYFNFLYYGHISFEIVITFRDYHDVRTMFFACACVLMYVHYLLYQFFSSFQHVWSQRFDIQKVSHVKQIFLKIKIFLSKINSRFEALQIAYDNLSTAVDALEFKYSLCTSNRGVKKADIEKLTENSVSDADRQEQFYIMREFFA